MSLEVSVRGWSSTDTGIWILGSWESLPGKGGALSSKTHYRGTRAINYELIHCSLLLLLLLFTQIKSAVCPEVFPPRTSLSKSSQLFPVFFARFKSSLNSPLGFFNFSLLLQFLSCLHFLSFLSASVLGPALPVFHCSFTFSFASWYLKKLSAAASQPVL